MTRLPIVVVLLVLPMTIAVSMVVLGSRWGAGRKFVAALATGLATLVTNMFLVFPFAWNARNLGTAVGAPLMSGLAIGLIGRFATGKVRG